MPDARHLGSQGVERLGPTRHGESQAILVVEQVALSPQVAQGAVGQTPILGQEQHHDVETAQAAESEIRPGVGDRLEQLGTGTGGKGHRKLAQDRRELAILGRSRQT